jgi:hypothetical protein
MNRRRKQWLGAMRFAEQQFGELSAVFDSALVMRATLHLLNDHGRTATRLAARKQSISRRHKLYTAGFFDMIDAAWNVGTGEFFEIAPLKRVSNPHAYWTNLPRPASIERTYSQPSRVTTDNSVVMETVAATSGSSTLYSPARIYIVFAVGTAAQTTAAIV